MEPNDVIIEDQDLLVVYSDKTILKVINFSVPKGKIYVIVGGSGCGKSTLSRQIIKIGNPDYWKSFP